MRVLSLRALAPLLAIAMAALTLVACASSSRPAPAPDPAPAACTSAQLRVTAGYSQGAGQHAIYDLSFANVSRAACTLRGYPGVALVTAGNPGGRPVGSPTPQLMQEPGPASTVTLAPGQHALALLGVAETVMFTGLACTPVVAHWLKVYPPHVRRAVYVPIKVTTCSASSDQALEVGAVYRDS
jgi:Protein of unknown function (DUF4232)